MSQDIEVEKMRALCINSLHYAFKSWELEKGKWYDYTIGYNDTYRSTWYRIYDKYDFYGMDENDFKRYFKDKEEIRNEKLKQLGI